MTFTAAPPAARDLPGVRTPSAPAVDLPGAFRAVASSAWVVTTADDAGCSDGTAGHGGDDSPRPVGFTAISVASVSLSPPLLSFNVSLTSSSLDALLDQRRVAVHLLRDDQEHLARRFAAPAPGRFPGDGSWAWDADGLPVLHDVVARLAGPVTQVVDAGDSVLLLVQPERTTVGGGTPLVHHARAYPQLVHPAG